jgi:glycerol kinase
VLEGIALRVAQIVRAMNADTGSPVLRLRADGGLASNPAMMQIQADVLGIPVEVLVDSEATVRGVCCLAARQTGLWDTDDPITSRVRVARVYEPAGSPESREQRLADFDHSISLLKSWPHGQT